ncbi:MAG: response regulator [Planctomycetes bacterium]|jgi:FixJ family two-component response regulator|nr:response regulator [Planctomycetota bacterium]
MGRSSQIVYVVDDDRAVRDSLQWLIESMGLQVKTFASGQAFLDHCHDGMVGCLVADLRLPGMSGLDMRDQMLERGHDLATIIITGHGDVPQAVRALKSGALDFIEKPFSDRVLLDRINDALQIDQENRDMAAHRSQIEHRYDRLTPRERQVMTMVVDGKLNKQIASELGLSHKTVEVHRSHVMSKMEAPSLAALVRMAMELHANHFAASASQ